MNCKYFKIRTKTIYNNERKIQQKYFYCSLQKYCITFNDCRGCSSKEYKSSASLKKSSVISGHKHKLTKATEIPMKVKKIVWERDNHCCLYCGKLVPVNCANSHYIKRSQLGLGIQENVVTACPDCHDKYDFGVNIEWMIELTEKHLKSHYKDWNKEKLVYKKTRLY